MGPGLAAPVPGALATGTVLSVGGGDVNGGAGAALRGKVIVFCSETEMLGPPCGAARLRGGGCFVRHLVHAGYFVPFL